MSKEDSRSFYARHGEMCVCLHHLLGRCAGSTLRQSQSSTDASLIWSSGTAYKTWHPNHWLAALRMSYDRHLNETVREGRFGYPPSGSSQLEGLHRGQRVARQARPCPNRSGLATVRDL